jgi:flagellar biosynthetic protein FliP
MNITNLPDQIRIIGFFAVLGLIPFVLVLMTSFTRISIVLTFLRQALGTSVPSTQIIVGLSLILTGYVMHPVIEQIHQEAITPYMNNEWKEKPESAFLEKAWPPLRNFMLCYTREKDLDLFMDLGKVTSSETLPWYTVIPAFVISELRTAFMMGFLLFLPFLVIDLVVTSLLMSMGMIMLPPVMISFPFKILLFVVVDGWHLIVQQMVCGFNHEVPL